MVHDESLLFESKLSSSQSNLLFSPVPPPSTCLFFRIWREARDELLVEVVGEEEGLDLEYYYLLKITLENFTQLKQDQSLRVDFKHFSGQFVSLIEKCFDVNQKEFTLSFTSTGEGKLRLNAIEVTTFRELSHVCLTLNEAGAEDVRRYLVKKITFQSVEMGSLKSRQVYTEKEVSNLTLQVENKDLEISQLKNKVSNQVLHEQEIITVFASKEEEFKLELDKIQDKLRGIIADFEAELEKNVKLKGEIVNLENVIEERDFELGEIKTELAMQVTSRNNAELSAAFREEETGRRHQAEVAELQGKLDLLQAQVNSSLLREELLQTSNDENLHKVENATKLEQELVIVKAALEEKGAALELCQALIEENKIRFEEGQVKIKTLSHTLEQVETTRSDWEKLKLEVESIKAEIELKNKVLIEQEKHVHQVEADLRQTRSQNDLLTSSLNQEVGRKAELTNIIESLKRTLEHNQQVLEENQQLITFFQEQPRIF